MARQSLNLPTKSTTMLFGLRCESKINLFGSNHELFWWIQSLWSLYSLLLFSTWNLTKAAFPFTHDSPDRTYNFISSKRAREMGGQRKEPLPGFHEDTQTCFTNFPDYGRRVYLGSEQLLVSWQRLWSFTRLLKLMQSPVAHCCRFCVFFFRVHLFVDFSLSSYVSYCYTLFPNFHFHLV